MVAFLRRITGNQQAAEDVMQETFAQIWKRPNGFQPERGTLRAYLFGAARKRAAEWWRKNGRENGTATQPDSAFRTETGSLVGDAFQRLPEEQRTLLWLREVEGQSYEELATVLDIPVGTVRSRLFSAREELRRVWNGTAKVKEV
jgi:RNA polymerase sigma-70 factor (ECF subfamily)